MLSRRVHALSQALWTGGLVAIDLVETPARFRAPGLDRNQVGAVGRSVFAAFNRYELGLAALSLLTSRGAGRRRALAVAAMAAAAAAQAVWLRPRMAELGAALDFEETERADPRYDEFRRLHHAYVALDAAKLAAGLGSLLGAVSARPGE